ncbi:hypothetical protein LF887_20505 [Chryseobacterium sp. MEBOG06]|uniref:hypothetical protein n=1 Tax=Chryseobacterium sp. MEBOG06 TaxID=2879938 RepID=UPI001F307D8E|nr:hypothetical protein [Chryseobacterium sp. MEBOG06]UKB83368.1 hypothetical protein LF887_20505 [Chryseobacterium sp. MEBOG06]
MKYLFFTFFCISMSFAQSSQYGLDKLGKNPVTFIDSVKVNRSEILTFDSNRITLMSVYDPGEATSLIGEDGKDGAIYIETKDFARKRFLRYFKSKSTEFSGLLESKGNDSTFQYIHNGKVLTNNFEGDLALIDDKVFKTINIITKKELSSQYNITDKDYGVIIASNAPEDSSKKE